MVAIALFYFFLFAPRIATAAEWYADIFMGTANTQNAEIESSVTMHKETCPGCWFFYGSGRYGYSTTIENAKFNRSFAFGGRVGYWKEHRPWFGVALDVSFFKANTKETEYKVHYPLNLNNYGDIKSQTIKVVPVTFLWMLRLTLLKNAEFKNGRLHPYAGIGLGFFKTDLEIDLHPEVSNPVSITEYSPGTALLAGLKWQVLEQVSILLEFRITQTNLDIDFDDEGSLEKELSDFKMKLKTHHTLVGVSYNF